MARQTINLPASNHAASPLSHIINWIFPAGNTRPAIDAALAPAGATRYLTNVSVDGTDGEVILNFTSGVNVQDTADLTGKFEMRGGFTLVADGQTLTVELNNADMTDPYVWIPSNAADVLAFEAALDHHPAGTLPATLTLFDSTIPAMKYNGVDISEWKYNGVEISAAKYNGIELQ